MCVAGMATAVSSARPTSSTAAGRRVTNVTQRWLIGGALAPRAPPRKRFGLAIRRPAKPSSAGSSEIAIRTAIATVPAAARPITDRNGMLTTQQADQGDDHGHAGEHDGAAGGARRLGHGLAQLHALGQVLLVAGEDEQRVVDADGEAEHRGQDRRGLGQVDHARERGQAGHADAHAERGGQQRHARGEQRGQRDRRARGRRPSCPSTPSRGGPPRRRCRRRTRPAGRPARRWRRSRRARRAPPRRSRSRARGRRRRRSRSCRPWSS